MTPRNTALLGTGAIALLVVGFATGRRVEADAGKTGQTNVSSQPLVPGQSTAATSSAVPATGAKPAGVDSVAGLFERLQAERDHRPKLEPTAETVFETVQKKAGVEVAERLQVAGWVVGAKFCDKLRSKKDVHIVVCEYATEAEAIAGQQTATNAIKRREVLRNKTTTCAVAQAGEGAASATEAARVKDLFKAL
jgi:hypothetical protein